MSKPKIKICGLTKVEETDVILEQQVEYVGIVLFYKKSKRYNTIRQAEKLLAKLPDTVKKVAVTVSPTMEWVSCIEDMGFDILQVHGTLSQEVLDKCNLPIFRAVNVKPGHWGDVERECFIYQENEKITGYVLDGSVPGDGKVFDWSVFGEFDRGNKLLILAGGLNAANVKSGIQALLPDIVDVSSGVEGETGKDREKIIEFVGKVRTDE